MEFESIPLAGVTRPLTSVRRASSSTSGETIPGHGAAKLAADGSEGAYKSTTNTDHAVDSNRSAAGADSAGGLNNCCSNSAAGVSARAALLQDAVTELNEELEIASNRWDLIDNRTTAAAAAASATAGKVCGRFSSGSRISSKNGNG